MPATVEKIENGYRLSNDLFEADISVSGATIGVTHLAGRGEVKRESIKVKELPLTLRLATDAELKFDRLQQHTERAEHAAEREGLGQERDQTHAK